VTVILTPPVPIPERILVFGGPGSGKTKNLIDIAKRCSTSRFHVIDSDASFGRMLAGDNSHLWDQNGGNISVSPVYVWVEYTDALDKIQKLITANDWIVADMISPAWEAVQDHFSEQVFGKGVEQFFLEARAAAKKGSAFDGRKDWTVINKLYRNWANQLTLKSRCHVYATAGVAAVQEDDGKEIRALFGRYGVKPTGQKENGHRFHTVLWTSRSANGQWRINTIKDRERDEMVDVVVGDFAQDYLAKVAGWKMVKA
jgi:hypothetical protein